MRTSKIIYDPSLSVAENAIKSDCSVDAIRYYIRTRGIDRRYEGKVNIIEDIKKYLQSHPTASKEEVARETHHGINTVRRYWDIVHGKDVLRQSEGKAQTREKVSESAKARHKKYLDKLPVEFIQEYLKGREASIKPNVIENPSTLGKSEISNNEPKVKSASSKKNNESKGTSKANGPIKCTDKYAYFYMKTPLSNWWTSVPSISFDGHSFTFSESVFMYLKAKGMGDDEYALKIVEADNDVALSEKDRLSKVKKLGRKCKWDEAVYIEKREEWMYTALKAKFKADKAFRDVLMAKQYRGLTFVEASPWDANWGIKSRVTKTILSEGESAWKGLNLLGKLLTKLRDEMLERGYQEQASIRCDYHTGELLKSICGGVYGDISGSTREKSSKSIYTTDFDLFPPRSRPTDDSILTVAVADWLLHRDTMSLGEAMKGWAKRYPNSGYGGGFRDYFKKNIEYSSDKNGAAMRVSPAAIVATSLEEALALAEETALPTHNTKEGIKGAQAIAAAIFLVREGVSNGKDASTIKAEVKTYVAEKFGYNLDQTIEGIRERSQRYAKMKKEYRETKMPNPEFVPMSDAATSVPMALVAFLEGNSYEEVLRIAISLGGDADTNACMASSISVHLYGIPKGLCEDGCKLIPQDMKNVIDEFDAKYLA